MGGDEALFKAGVVVQGPFLGGIGEERAPEPASEAQGEATCRFRHVASPWASGGAGGLITSEGCGA
jgi:hypothetical protein